MADKDIALENDETLAEQEQEQEQDQDQDQDQEQEHAGANDNSDNDDDDDSLEFLDEESDDIDSVCNDKWKVMIVDDEPDVHNATRIVLSDLVYEGKGLEFLSAYTAADAHRLLDEHPDTALILLDVVMEEDDTGLKLARYIREELKNYAVRIILRTGQPGQAPERIIIMEYDINDYKEKTELTVQKLFTTVVSSIRAYRDILTIENNKKGLEKIIESSANIFELQSMKKFSSSVLSQLINILNLHKNAIHVSACAITKGERGYSILAATGDFLGEGEWEDREYEVIVEEVLSPDAYQEIMEAFEKKRSKYTDKHLITYYKTKNFTENVIYMKAHKPISDFDRYLIDIYCANVSVAFENIRLNEEIDNTQREIIYTIGEIVETRSAETGYHVKRVAEYSKLLALKYGISEREADIISLAAPMHDIGKVGIADGILNKPGRLTEEEFEKVKEHSNIGYEILKHSNRKIIEAATIIAREHHEKFDGSGYPRGIKGEDIHIYGRITAIADVFDALGNDRVYKKAWPLEDILNYFEQQKGRHFDPQLIDIFFKHLNDFVEISQKYTNGH